MPTKIRVERLIGVDFLFQGVTDDEYWYTKSVDFFVWYLEYKTYWLSGNKNAEHRKAHRIDSEKFKADFATGSET